MMQNVTLSDLRSYIRTESEVTDVNRLSNEMLDYWINGALAELHYLLIDSDEDYCIKRYTFDMTSNDMYLLPSDFLAERKLFWIQNDKRYLLKRLSLDDLDDGYPDHSRYYQNADLEYMIIGNQIKFESDPQSGGTVELWYVPQFERLSHGDQVVHLSVAVQWEQYVVSDCVARALEREQEDASVAWARKSEAKQNIIKHMQNRSFGQPRKPSYVYDNDWMD